MSTYVDATSGAVEHCQSMAQLYPDLAEPYYDKIASYCKQKLWHQLTLTILDFVNGGGGDTATLRTTPEGTNSYLALYDKVVLSIDSKLNQLSLARIAAHVAASLVTKTAETTKTATGGKKEEVDATAAKAILENLLLPPPQQKSKLDTPAKIFVESKLALLSITTGAVTAPNNDFTSGKSDDAATSESSSDDDKQHQAIKQTIQRNSLLLKELMAPITPDMEDFSIVHSAHYEMAMKYYKIVGPPEAFYEQAMNYLNYAAINNTKAIAPADDKQDSSKNAEAYQLAIDLCLAAFTGDGIYNLGQVVTTPLLQVLKNTPEEWLMNLLVACSKGNVGEFQRLSQQHAEEISKQPVLVHRKEIVQEKMTLLALVNLLFEKSSSERTLGFDEIAERIQVSEVEQVEWVLMRAFSVRLIEGIIDQVDRTVTVTWVLPRVLDNAQLQDLSARFGEWAEKVSKTKDTMQEQTPTFT